MVLPEQQEGFEAVRNFTEAFGFFGVELVQARKNYEDEFGKPIREYSLYVKIPWGCGFGDYYRVSFESMKIMVDLLDRIPPIQNMIIRNLEQKFKDMSEAMDKSFGD